MNRIIYILFLIILSNCSLNQNSKFWTKSENIKADANLKVKLEEILKEEVLQKNLIKMLKLN